MSNWTKNRSFKGRTAALALLLLASAATSQDDEDLQKVLAFEARVRNIVERTKPAFVFVGGGSGVCISKDGWVLTNHHVAGPTGRQWKVFMPGGKSYSAKVVGHDPKGDISLLKIEGKDLDLPFCELGDSDKLVIGQHVFAIGNPFLLGNGKGAAPTPGARNMGRSDGNWDPTITLGVVSAVHRYQDWYMDAIHTDCQINPGNSGGPLLSLDGRVVGINGRIAMRFFNRVNTGVGYAISSNQIKRYLDLLKKGGRVWHGEIDGLTVADAGANEYSDAGEYGDGVLVLGVSSPSPASAAGFKEGDMITELAGYKVTNLNRFWGIMRSHPGGVTVPAKVKRGGEIKELKIRLTDLQEANEPKEEKPPKD
jgi:S1-C subfamily serine protease